MSSKHSMKPGSAADGSIEVNQSLRSNEPTFFPFAFNCLDVSVTHIRKQSWYYKAPHKSVFFFLNHYLKNRSITELRASQGALAGKTPPANAGDTRNTGSIPGSGRPPGGGRGNPPQCSCLENPMHRGAWPATVHRVIQSWTRLKRVSIHA